jgi:hypothetical protein
LRKYLNDEFLARFDSAKIALTTNSNGVNNSNHTTDRIFLISLDEVIKYLGNSESERTASHCPKSRKAHELTEEYNTERFWWWLRSTGSASDETFIVDFGGEICEDGEPVSLPGGVRPALWLKLGADEHD